MEKSENLKPPNPKTSAGFFSKVFYCWLVPFFFYGKENDIQSSDLYDVVPESRSDKLTNTLENFWNHEVTEARKLNQKPSLMKAIVKNYGPSFSLYAVIVALVDLVGRVVQPLLVEKLINYFENDSVVSKTEAYGYVFGIVFCTFSYLLLQNVSHRGLRNMGMCIRIACSSLIYRKTLRLPYSSTQQLRGGKIINLLTNDVSKFEQTLVYLHNLWVVPVQMVIVSYIMWSRIGIASLAGVTTLALLSVPLQVLCGKAIIYLRRKTADWADERILLMGEVINGIRVIKMYTWESPFEKFVSVLRSYELNAIAKALYVKSVLQSLFAFGQRSSLFVSIVVCISHNNDLSAALIFTLVQYFNVLHLSLNVFFLRAISFNSVTLASIKRVQDFLLFDEISPEFSDITTEGKKIILIKDVNASWLGDQNVLCLSNINISLESSKLYAISGPVGAGKSSLLNLVLRELKPLKGQVKVHGTVSFASQEPWIFPGSIRKNILFGAPYDAYRYNKVTRACALFEDFATLPSGDKTLVGDNGANLSGGQRARVNLARSVYRDSDVYLLDDPLSAVDSRVSKRIYEMCVKDFLKDKTCLLVTHRVQCLKEADEIILMNNGRFEFQGTYSCLQDEEKLLESILSQDSNNTLHVNDKEQLHASSLSLIPESENGMEYSETSKLMMKDKEVEVLKSMEDLMEVEEQKASKSIPYSLYVKYFRSGNSYCFIMATLAFFIATQTLCTGSDYWLAYWVKSMEDQKLLDTSAQVDYQTGLTILGLFLISIICGSVIRFISFSMMCVNSSKSIHNNMVSCLLRATVHFFDTNNAGRMLNRFSKDLGVIDEIFPEFLFEAYDSLFIIFGVLVQVIIINWKFLFPIVLLALVIQKMKTIALSTVQDLRRIEGNAKSPVLAHAKSSLDGVITIRACRAEDMICQQFDGHQDNHTSAFTMTDDCLMSYSLFADMLTTVFLAAVSFSFIVWDNSGTPGAIIGLAIVQILSVCGQLQKTLRIFAEISMQMVAVERLFQYTELEQEASCNGRNSQKPPKDWPVRGGIRFDKVSLRYSDSDGPVLKELEFSIEPGSKVGIVGRTGAGKSSLVAALFRLARLEGFLTIDEMDTQKINLTQLRRKISIIPQEPTLFTISLRNNLDPYQKYSDDLIWSILKDVEMKNVFDTLDKKLNYGNMSIGQRQLFCLARAILNENKIVVFDEATANIDDATDAFIQRVIKDKFKDCTVLTIAHKLNTIMDSDKVIVMDNGKAVEYDHPHNLLQNKSSYLSAMVQSTGDKMSEHLKKIAEESYRKDLKNEKTL